MLSTASNGASCLCVIPLSTGAASKSFPCIPAISRSERSPARRSLPDNPLFHLFSTGPSSPAGRRGIIGCPPLAVDRPLTSLPLWPHLRRYHFARPDLTALLDPLPLYRLTGPNPSIPPFLETVSIGYDSRIAAVNIPPDALVVNPPVVVNGPSFDPVFHGWPINADLVVVVAAIYYPGLLETLVVPSAIANDSSPFDPVFDGSSVGANLVVVDAAMHSFVPVETLVVYPAV